MSTSKRILVTGAAGFMGSHLVDCLVAQGHEVYCIDDMSGGLWRNIHPDSQFTVREAYCTADKAERLLGYKMEVPLEEGLRRMLSWARGLGPQVPRYLDDGLELVSGDVPATWREKLI